MDSRLTVNKIFHTGGQYATFAFACLADVLPSGRPWGCRWSSIREVGASCSTNFANQYVVWSPFPPRIESIWRANKTC
jgi:hypothetical protein